MSKTNQQPSKNRSKDHNTDSRQSNRAKIMKTEEIVVSPVFKIIV